jgi:hypothetical protein
MNHGSPQTTGSVRDEKETNVGGEGERGNSFLGGRQRNRSAEGGNMEPTCQSEECKGPAAVARASCLDSESQLNERVQRTHTHVKHMRIRHAVNAK